MICAAIAARSAPCSAVRTWNGAAASRAAAAAWAAASTEGQNAASPAAEPAAFKNPRRDGSKCMDASPVDTAAPHYARNGGLSPISIKLRILRGITDLDHAFEP